MIKNTELAFIDHVFTIFAYKEGDRMEIYHILLGRDYTEKIGEFDSLKPWNMDVLRYFFSLLGEEEKKGY